MDDLRSAASLSRPQKHKSRCQTTPFLQCRIGRLENRLNTGLSPAKKDGASASRNHYHAAQLISRIKGKPKLTKFFGSDWRVQPRNRRLVEESTGVGDPFRNRNATEATKWTKSAITGEMGEIHERRQKPWKHCVIVEPTEFLIRLDGRGKRI